MNTDARSSGGISMSGEKLCRMVVYNHRNDSRNSPATVPFPLSNWKERLSGIIVDERKWKAKTEAYCAAMQKASQREK
jgi:hypothetical protein